MEDSYTVHRRRKAAARRREKTPDASRSTPVRDHEIEDDEDDKEKIQARARMEKMVEDTEKLEEFANDGRNTSPAISNSQINPDDIKKEEITIENKEVNKETDEKIEEIFLTKENEEKIEENFELLNNPKQDSVNLPELVEYTDENCTVKATNENRMDFKRIKAKGESLKRHEKNWSSSDSSLDENLEEKIDNERKRKQKPPRKIKKEPKQEIKSSISVKLNKQIIPLSNDSLIEDLKKAQKNYEKREIGILDPELDDFVNPRIEAALRRRKKSHEEEKKLIELKEEINQEEKKQLKDFVKDEERVFGSWTKVWTWLWNSESKDAKKKEKIELEIPSINDKPEINDEISCELEKKKEKIKKEIPIVEKKIKIPQEIPIEPEEER